MRPHPSLPRLAVVLACLIPALDGQPLTQPPVATVTSVTQHGITWTFDQPRPVGRFVTGDAWVVGPVTLTGVSPAPQPAAAPTAGERPADVKSIYGATAMTGDLTLRNGSMVSPQPGRDQGYDSRLPNFRAELTARFPLTLRPGDSLVSTLSNGTPRVQVMHHALMWEREQRAALALRTAAVLTVVAEPPPVDAFRPAPTGTNTTFHRARDLRRDRLPTLPIPAGASPEWAQFERYLERPWIDHISSWLLQNTGPSENQVNYGREFSRITSIASLMLMLEVPPAQKETLLLRFVQLGIDLHGLAQAGRHWTADGGHWNGRKWPILFAGILLDDAQFAEQAARTLFSEDQQTYYGNGWHGQTALYQMVNHTGRRTPYEEKAPATWDAQDRRSEGYRIVVSGGLPGTALAVQLMGAKAAWNHDAFFDYYDRWMAPEDPAAGRRNGLPRPPQEGRSLDPFVDVLWRAYRDKVPAQPGATDRRKWVWSSDGTGSFVPNAP